MTTTLYRDGHVYSPTDPFATALVVEDDTIAWVGNEGAAGVHAEDVDSVVALDGALVTPAFVDPHVHLTSTGLNLLGLDLSATRSSADLIEAVRGQAEVGRGRPILGHGWDESNWLDPTPPSRHDLDRASFGAVVYLSRIDVHSCLASSALLALAPSISEQSGFSDVGWLTQQAHHSVRALAFESVTPEQRHQAQLTALAAAAELGIGMVHEMGGPGISDSQDFLELVRGERPAAPEIVGYWGERGGPGPALELGAHGAAGDLFIDGAIGSRTALLAAPYADADTCGAQYLTVREVRDHVAACSVAGVQAGFHVIGDGAMEVLCAGVSEAAESVGEEVVQAARHRLEHVEMIDDRQMALLAHFGIVASVQPLFDELWGGPQGMYVTRLGEQRAEGLNPFAAMMASGMSLALGSDSPVTPMGPWAAVRAAANHQNPQSRISVRAAFNAHTRGGWRAAGRDSGGVIGPGAPACLAVWEPTELVVQTPDEAIAAWSTDPRAGVPGLPALHPGAKVPACLQTIVHGRTVFSRTGFASAGFSSEGDGRSR